MVPGIGRLNVVCCQVGTWLSERRRGSTGVKVQACQLACSFPNSLSSRPLTARQSNSHVPSITRLQLQSSPSIPSPSPLKTTTAGIASGGLRAQAIARLAVRIALIAPVVIVVWAARKPTTPLCRSPILDYSPSIHGSRRCISPLPTSTAFPVSAAQSYFISRH